VFFSFSVLFTMYVDSWLVNYLITARLCSGEWHELFGMMMSVTVGFLYILNMFFRLSKW